ncbi:hypothetical protein SCP_0603140 [Sparassis crispa]|uniref:Endonuclease/exonuclease/phosphatase domain-containing protein n=1 Tax=Sparassis crispa TaxID=139825 RepID=A0A401GQ39_9APHY|nr:hypothetical protein SCP_0603140 [Sparassis crispa]GBE84336.1 hypothetical protein SCP_0603140 [Sparassis crispa]
MWDEERNHHLFTDQALTLAQPLLDAIASFGLEVLLPAATPTLQASRTKNFTCPDNVFGSDSLECRLTSCDVTPELCPAKMDHFPISTSIDVSVHHEESERRRNFRNVDWPEFHHTLQEQLASAHAPTREIQSVEDFNSILTSVMQAVEYTIDIHVPMSTPTPYTK